jgi:hypothetical protein
MECTVSQLDNSSEISSEGDNEKTSDKKTKGLWSKIKSFFLSNKKSKKTDHLQKSLKAFIQESKMQNHLDKNSKIIYKYPGLKEQEIEDFLMIYYSENKHECRFCLNEKILIIRIFQKDILKKIDFTCDLTRNSIEIFNNEFLNIGIKDTKLIFNSKFTSKNINNGSTKSNTYLPETPQNGIKGLKKIKGIRNSFGGEFSSLESTGKYPQKERKSNSKKVMNKNAFCEYDFDFVNNNESENARSRNSLNRFVSLENSMNHRNDDRQSRQALQSEKSRVKESIEKFNESGSKLRRMSRRSKSKLSNYFKSDQKVKNNPNMKSPLLKNFNNTSKKSNKKIGSYRVIPLDLTNKNKEKPILIPKSKLTLEWSKPRLNPFGSPKNKFDFDNILSSNNRHGFTSLKHIHINHKKKNDNKKENLYLNQRFSNTFKWPKKNDKKKNSKEFLSLLKSHEQVSSKSKQQLLKEKKINIFQMDEIDKLVNQKMKNLDFSRMNSNPQR